VRKYDIDGNLVTVYIADTENRLIRIIRRTR